MGNIITVDGLASAGKGTLSRRLAHSIGYIHVDNGLVFRAISLNLFRHSKNSPLENQGIILSAIKETELTVEWDGKACKTFLKGEDVTLEVLRLEIGQFTSLLASNPQCFTAMAEVIKRLCSNYNVVSDGRAVGTFIFPKADLKFFITATTEVRAQRRFKDLTSKRMKVNYLSILHDLQDRDSRDTNRSFYPLIAPQGAITIDTSNLSIQESLQEMLEAYTKSIGGQ